jgi:plastocyanin
MQDYDRRSLLRYGALATGTALAGCTSGFDDDDDDTDGTDATTDDAPATTTETETTTDDAPPGGDVLGGPDDLRSSAAVGALTLGGEQGAGQYVFSPAVVWLEQDATVSWTVASGSHAITAYHPDNDQPQRVPDDAEAFDSGILESGGTFEHTFGEPGVYNYYCTPHRGLGMVGFVVVDGPRGGPGASAPTDVESDAETSSLQRLLQLAGIGADDADSEEAS